MKVPRTDITPAPTFYTDPVGSVFYSGDEVFRRIRPSYENFYRRLIAAEFFPELLKAGLIDTEISDFALEGSPLVLKHRKIDFESVWGEWCSAMIKDATILMLKLSLALARRGLFIDDIKPGNVLFDRGRPVWIDFGAVVPFESINPRQWLRRFWQTSLFPLWLMSKRIHKWGRLIYREVPGRGLQNVIARRPFRWFPLRYRALLLKHGRGNLVKIVEGLLTYVAELEVEPHSGGWIEYREGRMPSISEPDKFNAKQKNVYRVLKRLSPGTLLDMGCNKGWYAQLAASLGYRVVAFDTDDETICHLYRVVKADELRILPLVIDFAWPTPNFGLGLGGRNAFERLQCDVTLGLALVHHLVFREGLKFETIAWILDRFTKSCAIVDFPPKDDITVSKWIRAGFEWYTLENFTEALRHYFPSIAIYESDPTPRQLLVCRRT
jgi:SAM-dependent methyltransferase